MYGNQLFRRLGGMAPPPPDDMQPGPVNGYYPPYLRQQPPPMPGQPFLGGFNGFQPRLRPYEESLRRRFGGGGPGAYGG